MIEILIKGLGIGLAIAAPVGPIGLLCIRRSIIQGRAAGLATGLGAAAADGSYGLLVAVGFSATGVLVSYASQMQLLGGLLICWLGLSTLRSFRAKITAPQHAAPHAAPMRSVLGAFGSTYVLTLSNPMTILAFVGMIAALGSAASGGVLAGYVLVAGVFLGSALWWLILVHMALWARGRLAENALHWLDLIAGSILLIWGAVIALSPLLKDTIAGTVG